MGKLTQILQGIGKKAVIPLAFVAATGGAFAQGGAEKEVSIKYDAGAWNYISRAVDAMYGFPLEKNVETTHSITSAPEVKPVTYDRTSRTVYNFAVPKNIENDPDYQKMAFLLAQQGDANHDNYLTAEEAKKEFAETVKAVETVAMSKGERKKAEAYRGLYDSIMGTSD